MKSNAKSKHLNKVLSQNQLATAFSSTNENPSYRSNSGRKNIHVQNSASESSFENSIKKKNFQHTLTQIPSNTTNEFKNIENYYHSVPGYYTQEFKDRDLYQSGINDYNTHQEKIQHTNNSKHFDYNQQNKAEVIEQILSNSNEWINIQNVVRVTFNYFYDLYNDQQQQMFSMQEDLNSKLNHNDLHQALVNKAEISDISKAMTEVISTVDCKPELDDIRKQLSQKMNRQEAISQYKTHQSMIDEIRKQENDFKSQVQDIQYENESIQDKIENIKKDSNKKLSQIYRELEKQGLQNERKVNVEDFNERLEEKADKQMVTNAVYNKISKSEFDQALAQKSDAQYIEQAISELDQKLNQEIQNLNDSLNRKSSIDDVQYLIKEFNFKLDKNELEQFRQEYVDRISQMDYKMQEKDQLMQQYRDAQESKLETQINNLKQIDFKKVESKVESSDFQVLKQDIRLQHDKLKETIDINKSEINASNEQLNEKIKRTNTESYENYERLQGEADSAYTEIQKIKDQLKFLLKERQDDISQISELLKSNQKKLVNDLNRVEKELNLVMTQTKKDLENEVSETKNQLESQIQNEMSDKVKVDEVQDALKRLTDNYQNKVESIYKDLNRNIQQKSDDYYDSLSKFKSDLNEIQQNLKAKVSSDKLDSILDQVEQISRDIYNKADKKSTQTQVDFLNENLTSLNREMLQKANVKDLMNMLDKKSNSDEIQLDINYLKNTLQKKSKDLKQLKEDQNQINETLCSENCVARYIWKSGKLDNSKGVINSVQWDIQSVNTCPENFKWEQGESQFIIDAAGLYEVTLAFFSHKKKPLIQVLQNNEVIVQTITKSTCGTCGSASTIYSNGHVQKMCNGLYKVSLIEFVALKGKALINVVFNDAKKKDSKIQNDELLDAEGFFSLRKL